jgi:hypothetical protein
MPTGPIAERPWKRISRLALWLCLAPPVGLWKLWKDPVLSNAAKWRVFVYALVLPVLIYYTISIVMMNSTLQRLLP